MTMFSTCIFCQRDLGSNEALEEFPVGRRLAYDPAKGRLWVVCRKCERWNLSPLEVRWEAIEACERFYRDTRLRVSTDNIGLAKLSEGLELVRVGEPARPEFAAWRYGDQFGRRRKRFMAYTTVGIAGIGIVVVGGAFAGVGIGGMGGLAPAFRNWQNEKTITRIRDLDGNPIRVQRKHLATSRLLPDGDGGWAIQVDHTPGWKKKQSKDKDTRSLVLHGDQAMIMAGQLMAAANRAGGRRKTIQSAVSRIEQTGDPERYLRLAANEAERLRQAKIVETSATGKHAMRAGSLSALPADIRLAVEMATHEQAEREAMLGELAELEAAWRAAEEIANIADNLFVSSEIEQFIDEEKKDRSSAGIGVDR